MPVTLAELAPTLADLGGADPIPGVRLPGFADIIQGRDEDPDRAVFSELIGDSCWRIPGPRGGPFVLAEGSAVVMGILSSAKRKKLF